MAWSKAATAPAPSASRVTKPADIAADLPQGLGGRLGDGLAAPGLVGPVDRRGDLAGQPTRIGAVSIRARRRSRSSGSLLDQDAQPGADDGGLVLAVAPSDRLGDHRPDLKGLLASGRRLVKGPQLGQEPCSSCRSAGSQRGLGRHQLLGLADDRGQLLAGCRGAVVAGSAARCRASSSVAVPGARRVPGRP